MRCTYWVRGLAVIVIGAALAAIAITATNYITASTDDVREASTVFAVALPLSCLGICAAAAAVRATRRPSRLIAEESYSDSWPVTAHGF
jgi:uncharacterized membrane protein YidH (DUF202 family)